MGRLCFLPDRQRSWKAPETDEAKAAKAAERAKKKKEKKEKDKNTPKDEVKSEDEDAEPPYLDPPMPAF